jgi:hypothetical protein
VAPDVTLLVRPYPMLADTDFFRALRDRPNVRFDEEYRRGRNDRSLTDEAVFERLNLQEHAVAFCHCGTTMGLECTYFDTPVLFLALDDFEYGLPQRAFMNLRAFIHQYHNDEYMILSKFSNVVAKSTDLPGTVAKVLSNPRRYLAYNRHIAAEMQPRSLAEIARLMVPSTPQ